MIYKNPAYKTNSSDNMETIIYEMLQEEVSPASVLDDIAMHFYSLVRAQSHIVPNVLSLLKPYYSFESLIKAASGILEGKSGAAEEAEEADKELTEEERIEKLLGSMIHEKDDLFLMDVSDFIEMTLDDLFDSAEDSVKEKLMEDPYLSRIRGELRQKNVLLLNPTVTADQIEMLYVSAFRRWDTLKNKLQKRVMSLSPMKAFEQGRREYEAFMKNSGYLMDDDDLIEMLQRNEALDELMESLDHKLYQAIEFGRHYETQTDEPDEEDTAELSEAADHMDLDEAAALMEEKEQPDLLLEDGDLRDQNYSYVCQLFPEYTGRRVFSSEEGEAESQAYWTTYEDEFTEIISNHYAGALEKTLNELADREPEKLDSLADQYLIPSYLKTDPWTYMSNLNTFSYYLETMFSDLMDAFGYTRMEEALAKGKAIDELVSKENAEG